MSKKKSTNTTTTPDETLENEVLETTVEGTTPETVDTETTTSEEVTTRVDETATPEDPTPENETPTEERVDEAPAPAPEPTDEEPVNEAETETSTPEDELPVEEKQPADEIPTPADEIPTPADEEPVDVASVGETDEERLLRESEEFMAKRYTVRHFPDIVSKRFAMVKTWTMSEIYQNFLHHRQSYCGLTNFDDLNYIKNFFHSHPVYYLGVEVGSITMNQFLNKLSDHTEYAVSRWYRNK
jgi:hypothetical protein